jgi:hypothetical protein
MTSHRWRLVGLSVTLTTACAAWMTIAAAQDLPNAPPAEFGQDVTPAYEGWFDNPDGTHSFLFGYYNRNRSQELDIPIGPNNRIEPGGPDRGQPTHFLAGRQWGMFVVTVPKDFPATDNVTWSITANGKQNSIPVHMKPEYNVDPFEEAAVHNMPPVIRFDEHGKTVQGPIATSFMRTATVGTPLDLPVWASDDNKYTSGSNAPREKLGDPIRLVWDKFRGPGTVAFASEKPKVQRVSGGEDLGQEVHGKATTTATFDQPGEYWLHLTANDYSGNGGGGSVCCWTDAIVKVQVSP